MLASSCYYNFMMGFGSESACNAYTHFGNSPTMMNCAFASCTAFLSQATSSNTDINKMLACNVCVRACFTNNTQSKQEALGTPGRAAYWLSDGTAFGYLTCCMLDTAFSNTVFLETLNRNIACVMCTPAFNCCAWGTVAGANTYTRSVCATNEVVNKGACCLDYTSCNFSCWYSSTYGVPCMSSFLLSGNTYFMDQFNALNSFRQRSCLFNLCENKDCYCSCITTDASTLGACNSHLIAKSEIIGRGGVYTANNANLPLVFYAHCFGHRKCPFTIANGSQLSNTEVEYLGRFIKCNYNVITHADCRLTLISSGFWNQSSNIACFMNCWCCSLDRTTANTSGLTINCGLYYTTDNAATFNRLCVPLPACIFQQLCGNVCCQFTVRYGLSSFACCNYVYTGWVISDCGTSYGCCCNPAFFKTGHSRVCLFANSQPNTASWTHFPDVPLPFYTVAFCDEYFAGVSPMRTDGYQTTLGLCNQICCQPEGQYALMFSFGRVGDCVRISCDNFVNNTPTGIKCFTPLTCCVACRSLPGITSNIWGNCNSDYFQGHGGTMIPGCYCFAPAAACVDTQATPRHMQAPAGTSHTLIYKNSANTADSKAFLVGWRSFAMMYGGVIGGACTNSCAVLAPSTGFNYNCSNGRGESTPGGCGYFRNSAGVNVWCYGSQANNTMEGSEIESDSIGGSTSSWTNFSFANAKIIGCRLVLAGAMPPVMTLCALYSDSAHTGTGSAQGTSKEFIGGQYGCQNVMGQTGHTTVFNTDGVVGTIVCCFDMMYNQTPSSERLQGAICSMAYHCSYVSGRCYCCQTCLCNCLAVSGGGIFEASNPNISDSAGLKTINLYGSSNSIYSIPAFPNMPPFVACCQSGSHPSFSAARLSCYTSPAPTGSSPFRSDKSPFCVKDLGDSQVCQFGTLAPLRPDNMDGYLHICNPGVSNAVGMTLTTHICAAACWQPCAFAGIYTPPSTTQDMATFDDTFNFCYIVAPHRDLCLVGPYCWNQACECFGENCSLLVPCSPCCPCCNTLVCCVTGVCAGTYTSNWPICDITRANGYYQQHICLNYINALWPCCMLGTPRYCNTALYNCSCLGNHHRATALANNTWQCAMLTCFHTICPSVIDINACCCSAANTYCSIRPYDKLLRTCNQAGPNCLWFDFVTSGVPGFTCGDSVCHLPCQNYWNSNFMMGISLNSCAGCLCTQGLQYAAADDGKRSGYRQYTSATCTSFIVDNKCYPILYSTQTRGSGGVTNTQNSIHIAFFDLTPFKCTVLAGSFGFYANGNACPGPSGTTCCLMFNKQELFYNVG